MLCLTSISDKLVIMAKAEAHLGHSPSEGFYHVVLSVMLTYLLIQKHMLFFVVQPLIILVLIGIHFMIISEMFQWRMYLIWVLLLIMSLFSLFNWEFMYKSLIGSIRSDVIHLCGFYKRGERWFFEIFAKREVSYFSHKKGGVGKIGPLFQCCK